MASALLSAFWFAHGALTGIGVPYPHPTPDQAAYQQQQLDINGWLLSTALLGWAFSAIVAVWVTVCRSARRPTTI